MPFVNTKKIYVLTRFSKVTKNTMIHMPNKVAKGMQPSALQQAIEADLAAFAGLFANLPAELRNDSLQV